MITKNFILQVFYDNRQRIVHKINTLVGKSLAINTVSRLTHTENGDSAISFTERYHTLVSICFLTICLACFPKGSVIGSNFLMYYSGMNAICYHRRMSDV